MYIPIACLRSIFLYCSARFIHRLLQTRGDLLSGEHFKALDRENAYRQEKNITRLEKENNVVEKGHTYPHKCAVYD